jgi:serine protease Do
MQTVLACFGLATKRTCIPAVFLVVAAVALPSVPAWAAPPPDPIADVVAKVRDAVVRITSVQPRVNPPSGKNAADASDANPPIEIGSGFIIDPSGLVATNRHVVENAVAVFVGTRDGGRYRAELIVSAGETDIALLKINSGEKLPVVTFGDSDTVRVGDAVIAIGDPFGFGGSVSAGVVSATNRNIQESPFDEYIQTDAAINHGSSGGPLFNLSGQVIGMDSVLFAPGTYSGSAGVGFAIPSNVLRFVLPRLENDGKVAAGRLPLLTQRVPELMAAAIGVPEPGGAVVIATTAQAEALEGKIQPGDVIKTFEGEVVLDPRDLARKAAAATVGSRVTLGVYRLGQMTTVEVPILALAAANPTVRQSSPPRILGLHLAAAPGTAKKPRVVVDAIDPSGSVADSGVKKGDVILRVQQQLVLTPEQAMAELQARTDAKHPYAALLVERDKKQSWIAIALPNEVPGVPRT